MCAHVKKSSRKGNSWRSVEFRLNIQKFGFIIYWKSWTSISCRSKVTILIATENISSKEIVETNNSGDCFKGPLSKQRILSCVFTRELYTSFPEPKSHVSNQYSFNHKFMKSRIRGFFYRGPHFRRTDTTNLRHNFGHKYSF